MKKKTAIPPKRTRWQSLLGTAILLLVVLFVYLRTGTLPDELLEGVPGTTTATVADTATHTPTTAPTAVAAINPTATAVAKSIEKSKTVDRATAVLIATEQPAAAATAIETSVPTPQPTATFTATKPPTRAPPTATAAATAAPTRIRSQSGLPFILYNDLPPEAQETIRLIDNNGPFPFRQDDSTFQNREGILPRQSRDWYREFTVITPGSRDRGARRVVEGEDGLLFYTDDHYASFQEVIR